MYPNKEKIQMMLTVEIIWVAFVYFVFILPTGSTQSLILKIIITAGTGALLNFLEKKIVKCPNCGDTSFFFMKKVMNYYSMYEYNRKHRQKPPECPNCGKTYGEYSNK